MILILFVAGMCVGVLLFKFSESGVGVDGGGGYGGVAEKLLDGFELCAVGEHGGGETVAQGVGRAALLGGDGAEGVFHHEAELVVGHAASALGEEEGS